MRSLLNILTIIFVSGTIYVVVKQNDDLVPVVREYVSSAISELENVFVLQQGAGTKEQALLIPEGASGDVAKIPKIDTQPKPKPTTPSTPTPVTKVVLPSPYQTIETPVSTGTTGNISSHYTAGPLSVQGIVSATNVERAKSGLVALVESAKLDASAKVKADDILAREYFEHTAPDGKTIGDLVAAEGYQYIKIGENLALGNFFGDVDVVNAWMNSPGHRANILDATYTEIGVGVAYGIYQGRTVAVGVQHFGKPRSACPSLDAGLKAQVETGQKELDQLVQALNDLKKRIDTGKLSGSSTIDMNDIITAYNQGVEAYQKKFALIDALRIKYNAQVAAFNSCITR